MYLYVQTFVLNSIYTLDLLIKEHLTNALDINMRKKEIQALSTYTISLNEQTNINVEDDGAEIRYMQGNKKK